MDREAKLELTSLVDRLSPQDRTFIACLSEDDVVIRLHHGLGGFIRNEFRGGRLTALLRWSRIQMAEHATHMDELSRPILLEILNVLKLR